jgi:hypothetical protein
MDLEHGAVRLVEPGEEHDLVARRESRGGGEDLGQKLDPRVRAPSRPCIGARSRARRAD